MLSWPPLEEALLRWEVIANQPVPDPSPPRAQDHAGSAPGSDALVTAVPNAHVGDVPDAVDRRTGERSPASRPAAQGPSRPSGRSPLPWWAFAGIVVLGAFGGSLAGSFLRTTFPPGAAAVNVDIETIPPGGRVVVDGEPQGMAPVRLRLAPGQRRVAVTVGGVTREAILRLSPGTDVTRVFDFGAAPVVPTSGSPLNAAATTAGTLEIQTTPPGAEVSIAGRARGTTPLTVSDLPPGEHEVQLKTAARTVTQRVQIAAGKPAMLVVPMAAAAPAQGPGWVTLRAPVPLRIFEGGRVVGTTEADRIMLPAGRHQVELVNEHLDVRIARTFTVQGGRGVAVDVPLPEGRVSVNAQPWAEVFVGDRRLGDTPLANVSLPVGEHEILFRHPQLGERRQVVTVRAATPARVSVSFKP